MRELADGLRPYPLAGVAEASWGYENVEGDNIVLLIRVVPVNSKGDLIAEAIVADLHNLNQRVSATFSTTYAEAEVFRQQLDALVGGRTNEAELTGLS